MTNATKSTSAWLRPVVMGTVVTVGCLAVGLALLLKSPAEPVVIEAEPPTCPPVTEPTSEPTSKPKPEPTSEPKPVSSEEEDVWSNLDAKEIAAAYGVGELGLVGTASAGCGTADEIKPAKPTPAKPSDPR